MANKTRKSKAKSLEILHPKIVSAIEGQLEKSSFLSGNLDEIPVFRHAIESIAELYPKKYANVPDLLAELSLDNTSTKQVTSNLPSTHKVYPRQLLENARDKLERFLLNEYNFGSSALETSKNDDGFKNIVSVGIGKKSVDGVSTGEDAVIVTVARKVALEQVALKALVPASIDGIPTDVVVGDHLRPALYRGSVRPVTGGVSVGNSRPGSGSGTICCVVVSDQKKKAYILSCNHVLALLFRSEPGDHIIQPSIEDGGRVPDSVIGVLTDAYPINFTGDINFLDCALAQVDPKKVSVLNEALGRISDIPAGVGDEEIVFKCGRTTGLTESVVKQQGVVAVVEFEPMVKAKYGNLIAVEQRPPNGFASQGDSGALIVNSEMRPVGMIFMTTPYFAYAIPIEPILKNLGVRILTTPARI